MNAHATPLLLASIHDVSPRFESEVDGLAAMLSQHVGDRIAMLVVPNHWGDAPIVPGSSFATRLRNWAAGGTEIFLHGYYHLDDSSSYDGASDRLRAQLMTNREGEFLGLDRSDAVRRIARGRDLLEQIIGRPIDGFIAPAWLYGKGALQALADCSIAIAEDHWRVWSPVSGDQLARGPVITWASRTRLRKLSSLAAAAAVRKLPLGVMRIGVHPPDLRHPALVRSIETTFRVVRQSRSAARYQDLLP